MAKTIKIKHRSGGPVDRLMATELELYLNNDEPLYRRRLAMEGAIAKHICRGNYTFDKAVKGFTAVVTEGARKYVKEFAMTPGAFNPATRTYVARDMAETFQMQAKRCAKNQECDDVSPTTAGLLNSKSCKVGGTLGRSRRRA